MAPKTKKKVPNGIQGIKVDRALTFEDKEPAAGHVFYVITRPGEAPFAIQLTLEFEQRAGKTKVLEYVEQNYGNG